jgi:ABC-type amino acid transport substrate-binding protein
VRRFWGLLLALSLLAPIGSAVAGGASTEAMAAEQPPGLTSQGQLPITRQSPAEIPLTTEERAWLDDHPVLRMTGDPDWLPQEAFTADGTYVGIVADVLDLIEPRLGVRFERVPVPTWSEALRMAEAGEVDLLSETTTSGRQGFRFTSPYVQFPVAILARRGPPRLADPAELRGQRLGVVTDYGYVLEFEARYPDIETLPVETVRDGLLSLEDGGIDAFLATNSTASYLITELGLSDLEVVGFADLSIELGFGVARDQPLLLSILNKGLASLTGDCRPKVQMSAFLQDRDVRF